MSVVAVEGETRVRRDMPDLVKARAPMRAGANSFRAWFSFAA